MPGLFEELKNRQPSVSPPSQGLFAEIDNRNRVPLDQVQLSDEEYGPPAPPVEAPKQEPIGLIRKTLQSWGETAMEKGREKSESLPGRDIPVVGSVLKAADVVSSLPPVEGLGDLGRSVYTPGAGLSNVAGLYGGVKGVFSKFLPGLAASKGGRIAQEALTEAATGVPLTAGQSLAQTGELGESVKEGLMYGGLGGAGLGAAGRGIVEAAPVIKQAAWAVSERVGGLFNELANAQPKPLGISALKSGKAQKTRVPDSPERVMDVIDVGGKPVDRDKGSWWERMYTSLFDELAPLNRATKELGGKDVPTESNPFRLAWLARGWRGKADSKIEYGFMDDAGNKVSSSLKEVLDPVKSRLDELREYAVAMRSMEYVRDNLESGVPFDLAKKTIENATPEIRQAFEGVRKYINDMNMDTLVKSGIWSEEKLLKLQQEQPNYIPMFRTQDKALNSSVEGAGTGKYANAKDPTKQRTGSRKPIVDPIESIIKQTYKNQALSERNAVMRTLVELAEQSPENALIQKVDNSKAVDEIQKSLDEFISNPTDDMEKRLTEALDLFKPQTVNGKPNVFTVMRNGKAEQWQVMDDALAEVIAGMNKEQVGLIANLLGKPTGALKAGLVLTLDFITKNLVRDQFSAFVNSKYGFIPIWDTLSGLMSALKKDEYFYQWMANGGANGAWVSLERDYLQGQIRRITESGIGRISKNPLDWLRVLSEYSEQATRLGEFKKGAKKGADLKDAALAARDVTLDFSRTGSKTRGWNKAVAFANVALQSLDKLARQFDPRNPKQFAKSMTKATTFITFPSVALFFVNHNNPKYQELPQWEKDGFWHIPAGDSFVRIPKPFELGIIFGTFPERLLQKFVEDDPKAFEGFAKGFLDGFTPSIIPTLFAPWIEAYSNKKMFTKAPVIPRREEGYLPEDQVGPYTSQVGRMVGKVTDTSPRIVDNFITGYTGSLGKSALSATDKILERTGMAELTPKPSSGSVDIPGLRPFSSRVLEGSTKSVDDFYKEKERLTKERNSARKNQGVYKEEVKYKQYERVNKQISELNTEVRSIMANKTMTPGEKRDKLKELNLKITNLARQVKGLQPISE